MPFKSDSYFTFEAIQLAKHFISQNEGNEILMVGKVDDKGFVYELRKAAMGNAVSVPAVLNSAQNGEILIHNHPNGDVRPSVSDLDIAAKAAEMGIGSYIVDNLMLNVFPIVERILPECSETELVDYAQVAEILGKNGRLNQVCDNFEFRKPQVQMALRVAEAINSSTILSAEAGTGTGKSFAYLIPTILYVSKNKGKKAVISASTIALQEQLFDKDLPFLFKKLEINDVDVAVLKGRGNYLCKRKYFMFRMSGIQENISDKNKNRADIVDEIDVWMTQMNDGSRSSMNSALSYEIWSEICAEELSCEKSKCPYFNSCYFFKARRRANFASIILINHHLLMADVAIKMEEEESGGILPKFDILIIDEAHNIFKNAMGFLGESVAAQSVVKQLDKLYSNRKSGGLLTKILNNHADKSISPLLEKAINTLSSFTAKFANSLIPELISILERQSGEEEVYALDDINLRAPLFPILEGAASVIMGVVDLIRPLLDRLIKKNDEIILRSAVDDYDRFILTETGATITKLTDFAAFYTEFCIGKDSDSKVFWGEKEKNSLLTLTITPLNIQKLLAEQLYDLVPTLILTSATLTTGKGADGFDFFYRESGLNLSKRKKESISLESCFNYKNQVKVFVGSDLPTPLSDKEMFEAASIEAAKNLAIASNGGALALFTSISHRNEAAKHMTDLKFDVFCQGKLPNAVLVKRFRENIDATLLATDVFWEGIDMKGSALRNLIIIKLPFKYPNHPFIKKYVQKLERESGKSGFKIYTLPNAILKFKQGFGRLIRTKEDVGTITILDKRIIEKNYGKDFVQSAPEGVEFHFLPIKKIEKEIELFFSQISKKDRNYK